MAKNKQRKMRMQQQAAVNTANVQAPVAKTKVVRAQAPAIVTTKNGVTMTHRELVTTISNSTAYSVNGGISGLVYRLNPTAGQTFTWLPSMAANFDQYRFSAVELEYIPMCGTTATGRVGLWFDKDSEDSPPGDRVELANMGSSVETAPWNGCKLSIPTDQVKRFCVGSASVADAKLVDLGQVGFSVYGGGDSSAVGDLFIRYTVTLHFPQPSATLLQTQAINDGGVETTSVGPSYFASTRTATQNDLIFKTPGVFFIGLTGKSLTYTGQLVIGAAVINSNSVTATATGYCGLYNVTITKPGDGMRVTGTGFQGHSAHVARCRTTNVISQ